MALLTLGSAFSGSRNLSKPVFEGFSHGICRGRHRWGYVLGSVRNAPQLSLLAPTDCALAQIGRRQMRQVLLPVPCSATHPKNSASRSGRVFGNHFFWPIYSSNQSWARVDFRQNSQRRPLWLPQASCLALRGQLFWPAVRTAVSSDCRERK